MTPRELAHRFADLCTAHDVDGFAEVIAMDYRQHNPMVTQGLLGIQDGFAEFLRVFPDLTATVDAVAADGDLVAARFSWEGTHRAELFGIPASGRRARWTSSDWWLVDRGMLVEHWDVVDWAGLTAQLAASGSGAAEPAQTR